MLSPSYSSPDRVLSGGQLANLIDHHYKLREQQQTSATTIISFVSSLHDHDQDFTL
jgi:hypothetical protein